MFIPSWVNEKKNDVSTNKVVWFCGIASFLGYLCIGMLTDNNVHLDDSFFQKKAVHSEIKQIELTPTHIMTTTASL